ncbi:MAG TPA: hypothetical protein VNK23_12105 [Candidatus Dormibacteraeota bacterium]|nr:hypothetical protein [Candidatus Dormibacteraeota bacterium]
MNNSKNKRLKSGAWLWLKRGQVPRDAEDVRLGINRIAADLADEFAGVGKELTPSQLVLIDRASALLGFCKLVERAAMREGVIVTDELGKPRLSPGLSGFYVAASNAVSRTMKTLADISPNREIGNKPLNLAAYLKSKDQALKQ